MNPTDPEKVTTELYSGKQITRELYRIALPHGYYTWKHLQEMWRVKQIVVDNTGKTSVEERFFLSSLAPQTLNNSHVLQAVRMHWGIENNGFWVCDTAWQEDDAPWTNNAMVFVSLLRLIAYNIVARLLSRRMRSAKARAISWTGILRFIGHALCRMKSFFDIESRACTQSTQQ